MEKVPGKKADRPKDRKDGTDPGKVEAEHCEAAVVWFVDPGRGGRTWPDFDRRRGTTLWAVSFIVETGAAFGTNGHSGQF